MIYRKRSRKTGYSIRVLRQTLKIEFGTRVWYFGLGLGYGKPFYTLSKISDSLGLEIVTHVRRRNRVTVYRGFVY